MGKVYKDKGTESISRNLIFDNELSDRARFVYCFMMAKPDKWDFLVSPMAKELGYSPDTLHKYINELIQRGWLTKVEQSRDEQKRFGAVDYIIHETRQESVQTSLFDDKKSRYEEKPLRKKAVTEKSRDGKKPPQKDNIDNKEIQDLKEIEENIISSTIVDEPQGGLPESGEEILKLEVVGKKSKKREKKKEDGEEKEYTITHRCRLIFEQLYLQFTGEEYYYEKQDAASLKYLINKIKSKMPEDEKNNDDAIEYNFTVFIQAIIYSGKVDEWFLDNFSLPVINSKFNVIHTRLKNGTTRQQQRRGPTDEFIRRTWEELQANGGLAF